MEPTSGQSGGAQQQQGLRTMSLMGTPLALTTYEELSDFLYDEGAAGKPLVIDFTNTHIVTLRRSDDAFREITSGVDYFIPDGMPLIWCLNARGAGLKDRVYGPTFLRECVRRSPGHLRHYFLGASEACLNALKENLLSLNPGLTIAGMHHGYFGPEQEEALAEAIRASGADLIWIGLGTPKQQEWIARWRGALPRGVLLAVGFAFDVNAGTKKDAPEWMQRWGLTWLFRLLSEPRRLWKRYLVANSQFLWHLIKARGQ